MLSSNMVKLEYIMELKSIKIDTTSKIDVAVLCNIASVTQWQLFISIHLHCKNLKLIII